MIETLEQLQPYFPRYNLKLAQLNGTPIIMIDRVLNKREQHLCQQHGKPDGGIGAFIVVPASLDNVKDVRSDLHTLLEIIRHGPTTTD